MKNKIKIVIITCVALALIAFFTFMLFPRKLKLKPSTSENIFLTYTNHKIDNSKMIADTYIESKSYSIIKSDKDYTKLINILKSHNYRRAFKFNSTVKGIRDGVIFISDDSNYINIYIGQNLIYIDNTFYKLAYNKNKDDSKLVEEIFKCISKHEITKKEETTTNKDITIDAE